MGALQIKWSEVAKLESLYHYEIRLSEGKRHYGKIDSSSRPGELHVSDAYGERDLSMLQVVELRPVSKSFKDQIDVYLAFGYSYTNASSLGQGNVNTDISYKTEQARNLLSARSVITDSHEDTKRSSKLDLSRSVWTNREGYIGF